MIKKGDILTKKPSYQLLNARFYHTTDVLDAMQEYAEEYHQSELLKLNKSDVISSLSESEECKCIRFVGGDKYYPNGCEIHPNG